MKKKLLILVLAFAMCITLAGCGKTESNNSNNKTGNDVTPSNSKYVYTYEDGKLTPIVDEEGNPKQTDFVIDGLILIGNRHEYRGEDNADLIINYFVKQGYKKEGLNKDFYLNEWIAFYIDTKYSKPVDDVKIIVVPHRTVEELEKLSLSQLEALANDKGGFVLDYKTPEEDNYKFVSEGYVNSDYPEGKYDILFTYRGKLAYFININLTKEPTE